MGGSLDGQNSNFKKFYSTRGFRILEEKIYSCTLDLFSSIPSLQDPQKTLLHEFKKFNKKIKIHSKARLIKEGLRINSRSLNIGHENKLALLQLLALPEKLLEGKRIDEHFTPSFFETNFWIEFCTIFSFQQWHSLIEFKRYLLRVSQDLPVIDTTKTIRITPYNQYDSIISPTVSWLKKQGVNFKNNCEIENVRFGKIQNGKKIINRIYFKSAGRIKEIQCDKNDYVFLTIGSMTTGSSIGSMDNPAKLKEESWTLWENIAKKSSNFGKPSVFNGNIEKSKWISFTITTHDRSFLNMIQQITKQKTGTEGPMSFPDSNWLITLGIPYRPYFLDQPKDTYVCWGYGLFPDKKGNFINKKMSECNGKELFLELCYHFGFQNKAQKILKSTTCIPCMMPYITSQFMPRKDGDRPQVVPTESENFAFLGQFCEMPEDIVFTIEYSVRSAQTAVYKLLQLDKDVCPIYKGYFSPKIIYDVVKTIFR